MSHTFALPSLNVRSAFLIGGIIAFISGFMAVVIGLPLFCLTTVHGDFTIILSSPVRDSLMVVLFLFIAGSGMGSAFSAWVFNRSVGYARYCGIAI